MEYRVWCKNKNEWERGDVVIRPDGTLFDLTTNNYMREETHIVELKTKVNGIVVFVGDIIEVDFLSGKVVSVVTIKNSGFWLENIKKHQSFVPFGFLSLLEGGFKLIGNIHENKELLEEVE